MFDQHLFCRYVLTHRKAVAQTALPEREMRKGGRTEVCGGVKKYLRGTSTMVFNKNLRVLSICTNLVFYTKHSVVCSHLTTFQNVPLVFPVYFKAGEMSSH